MTDEEVKDPAGLLAAYNKLKDELREATAKRDELQATVETLSAADRDNEWRNRALTAEVKSSLTAKGLKDADRLIKVLGTDGVDFDDEGKVTGLDERLAAATKDFPELFDPKTRAGGKADAFATGPVESNPDPLLGQVSAALNRKG